MPVMFNSLLSQFDLAPADVILLRHQDTRAATKRTPYELWRDDPPGFERYQSCQTIENRARFMRARNWTSFVATPDGATMFVGLYTASYKGLLEADTRQPHTNRIDSAGSLDVYDLRPDERMSDLEGKLFIEWGDGARAWVQRADNQNKQVVELRREFKEDDFPGYLNFIAPLSRVKELPAGWIARLREATGIYLLTCPRTHEQYVGSASGGEGFWQRWIDYSVAGHGGNIALKSREPSDYQVSILEVAGSALSAEEILKMEARWKAKLQSQEMGLNRN